MNVIAKKLILFFLTLCTLALSGIKGVQAATSLDPQGTQFQTLEMAPTTLKENFTSDLLLLDFWASWCEPCKESLPFFAKLEKRYSKQGLQILAVSVDEELKEAKAFVAKNNFSLTFLWDPKKAVAKSLELKAIPTTLLVDKSGKIIYQERGFSESSKAKLEAQIQKTLKK